MSSISTSRRPQHYQVSRSDNLLQEPDPPVSLYNLFFQEERARLFGVECNLELRRTKRKKQGRSEKLPLGITSLRDLSSHIQARWKELPTEAKQKYTSVYMSIKAQYTMELALHKAAVGITVRRANTKRGQMCLTRHNAILHTPLVFASGSLKFKKPSTTYHSHHDEVALATKPDCSRSSASPSSLMLSSMAEMGFKQLDVVQQMPRICPTAMDYSSNAIVRSAKSA
jgi:hypothetical protein